MSSEANTYRIVVSPRTKVSDSNLTTAATQLALPVQSVYSGRLYSSGYRPKI